MTTASGTPTAMESPKPARVSQRVAQVCPGRWTRCSHAAPTISEGAGRMKVGTLKSRLHRAHAALMRHLAEEAAGEV